VRLNFLKTSVKTLSHKQVPGERKKLHLHFVRKDRILRVLRHSLK